MVVAVLAIAATFVRWGDPLPELELLVLGPDGQFHQEISVPVEWADTSGLDGDAVARFRLILGVRNVGHGAGQPQRLVLGVPARYRLTDAHGQPMPASRDLASPLVRYVIETRMETVEPRRMPALLPAHEVLWLEAIVPRYYCVELADSIPEFVAAPPPPVEAMSQLRVLYVMEGPELEERQTGTLTLQLDPSLLDVAMPEQPPSFPMQVDPELAMPELENLRHVATHEVRCGEPEAPMEMLSVVWEGEAGSRMIVLEYGGAPRKYLFDLDGDGVIDRETWDPEGRGAFTATRQARLPIPGFLLPRIPSARYDLAEFQGIPPDSLARLDPLAAAMEGPGPMPLLGPVRRDPPTAPRAPAPTPDAPAGVPAPAEEPPAPPAPPPAAPLGRPIPDDG